ncbi:MarR family transcriptional regulator [Oricola sp.]|uniref:MarR family winged helix-turn-helix transcriptional regulator n=1 Tax=Oricola sp. TaxID=1979950 RepID=UPI0025CC7EF7|nr:MarR family transcriptional regulator [Oricola sp.]MCI5076045.1 MarR family transcriptional regulator [Oricola sp.]
MTQTRKQAVLEPASKARLRLWLRLLKASRHVEAELRERLRVEFATTLPRFDVMSALYRVGPGLKMSELSGVLKVSNGNVTGIVDRLVEDGFALREKVHGDKRAFRAVLTSKGRAEFERQAAAHERWVNELLGEVEPDSAVRLSALLAEVARSAGETEEKDD